MMIGHMDSLVRYIYCSDVCISCLCEYTHHTCTNSYIIVYDYLELCKSQKEALQSSKRISNPGCYPTGFIALTRPLVDAGIIPADAPLSVNAIAGYSGGGNALIDIYESDEHEPWGAYGYSMVRLVQFTCVVSYLILHLGHL